MIVNTGKDLIKQYFGGQVPVVANAIAFGSGTTAPTLTDTALQTEALRVPVTVIAADLTNSRIVFKCVVMPSMISQFTEIGLFYGSNTNSVGGIMVARRVLDVPEVVDTAIPTEIEYSLGITV